MYLNAGFASLINSKLGSFAVEVLDERRVAEAKRCFESSIKCNFNPLASYCEDQYEIPLPGARDIPCMGLEGGFLTLSKYIPLFSCSDRKTRDRFSIFTYLQKDTSLGRSAM
jgi:hypothetical protein